MDKSQSVGITKKVKPIKRSYSFIQIDLDNIEKIKDRALNRKLVLTDSQVVRMALMMLSSASENELEQFAQKAPKIPRR
ncbi:MAG TPA: hypothetical protein VHE99_11245 [Gammaproteobacteria bacterium]|nr:hypothetical protein [Gammaproteobacteria bacterium]